ncbi:MAG: hypothetical protein EHM72_19175 [Calditrichaeota bacterium]|nr:MAG: hypothetical protein EHM72_19175 [Calditrichota bacterium]
MIKQNRNPITKLMGGIEVLVADDHHRWRLIETINEQGPLATDVHLIPLPILTDKALKLRLRMTKGNWRIDWAALTTMRRQIDAIPLPPVQAEKEGIPDTLAQQVLTDSVQVLTTLPGDEYTLYFRTPGGADDYELFLESRGYYLEWIREEWITEENPRHLRQIFLRPHAALKRLAPEFKRVEAEMEDHFWRSRYAKP